MNPLDELIATFRWEAADFLDEIAKILESQRGGPRRPDAFVAARRVAHNLKGAALTVGAQRIAGPCHAFEEELEIACKNEQLPTAKQVEDWLRIVTHLQRILDDPKLAQVPASGLLDATRAVAKSPSSNAATVGETRSSKRSDATQREARNPGSNAATVGETKSAKRSDATQCEARNPSSNSVSVGETRTSVPTVGTPIPAGNSAVIRVETRRLDDVMAHAREVAQTQLRLCEQIHTLQTLVDDRLAKAKTQSVDQPWLRDWGTALGRLRQETREAGYLIDALTRAIGRVRMTQLSGMVPLWQRTVRETANELGRSVQLEVALGDTEVDLRLCELIKDPLLHILRNAVAHGIEPSGIRQAAGKPPVGRIRIEARADGSFVELRISDDGKGVNVERVKNKALERGWISAAAAESMTDAERRALVFLPGLSTAEVVTTIAGRGMGLHSVQRNLEELGGRATLLAESDLGGSTFKLRIPAMVLSVKAVLVNSGSVTYALPLHDVVCVAVVEASSLEQSEGQPYFRDVQGRPIRVRSLNALLGRTVNTLQPTLHLVVLRSTGQELALVVDTVIGEREFITRPMPWNIDGVAEVNGVLILPDGSVALSLDSTALFAAARQSRASQDEANAENRTRRGCILVVDDSLAVRTLESQTLSSAGYNVSACPDGLAAWRLLEKQQFDLVVCDVQMPGMDGFELTTRIRASANLRHLPIILVTALSTPMDVARGAQVGADSYIIKGELDQDRLLRDVRRLIR